MLSARVCPKPPAPRSAEGSSASATGRNSASATALDHQLGDPVAAAHLVGVSRGRC